MAVFWLSIGVFALFFLLMSVRLIFIKDGSFRGTCASQNPVLTEQGVTCGFCGKTLQPGDACGDPEGAQKLTEFPKIKK